MPSFICIRSEARLLGVAVDFRQGTWELQPTWDSGGLGAEEACLIKVQLGLGPLSTFQQRTCAGLCNQHMLGHVAREPPRPRLVSPSPRKLRPLPLGGSPGTKCISGESPAFRRRLVAHTASLKPCHKRQLVCSTHASALQLPHGCIYHGGGDRKFSLMIP